MFKEEYIPEFYCIPKDLFKKLFSEDKTLGYNDITASLGIALKLVAGSNEKLIPLEEIDEATLDALYSELDPSKETEDFNKDLDSTRSLIHIFNIKKLLAEGADVNYKDIDGKTPLFYAKKQGNQEVVDLLIKKGAIDTEYTVKDVAIDTEYTPLQQALLFNAGFMAGKTILKPAINYVDDAITGSNSDKAFSSYYTDQLLSKNFVKAAIYAGTTFGLSLIPGLNEKQKDYITKIESLALSNTGLISKLIGDAIYNELEFSIGYATELSSYIFASTISSYTNSYITGSNFYTKKPFTTGTLTATLPDLIKLAYHSYQNAIKEEPIELDNTYQRFMVSKFGVTPKAAVGFSNQYQVSAFRMIHVVSKAIKFENKYQFEAFKVIHNVEQALEFYNPYQLRALNLGVAPEDAVKFSNECQISALLNKIPEEHCQIFTLEEGSQLKFAIESLCGAMGDGVNG